MQSFLVENWSCLHSLHHHAHKTVYMAILAAHQMVNSTTLSCSHPSMFHLHYMLLHQDLKHLSNVYRGWVLKKSSFNNIASTFSFIMLNYSRFFWTEGSHDTFFRTAEPWTKTCEYSLILMIPCRLTFIFLRIFWGLGCTGTRFWIVIPLYMVGWFIGMYQWEGCVDLLSIGHCWGIWYEHNYFIQCHVDWPLFVLGFFEVWGALAASSR